MKVDYLSLCYRGSDNPAFIWFCDFLSKASRLSCDYQSRALCLSDGTSATEIQRSPQGVRCRANLWLLQSYCVS